MKKVSWNLEKWIPLNQIINGEVWFIRASHRELLAEAGTSIFNLQNNVEELQYSLKESNKKLADAEKRNQEDAQELTNRQTQIITLQKKAESTCTTLIKLNEEVVQLEEVNHRHNETIDNYDKKMAELEKKLEAAEEYKVKYEELVNSLDGILRLHI